MPRDGDWENMRTRKGPPGVSIYKPKARSKPWHKYLIHYKEGGRDVVRSVATDFDATYRHAAKVSERLERERLGLFTGRERSAIAHAATPLLPRLDDYGFPCHEPDGRFRPNHLHAWLEILRTRRITPRWIQMLGSRCMAVIARAEFEVTGDIVAEQVELALGALADEEEHSDQTSHHYCKAMKQFTRWLRKSGRALVDELEDFKPPSVLDVVHKRRAMEEWEIAALIRAAENGVDYRIGTHVICGKERALLYRLAVETGLRANELRQLTPESFVDLEGARPVVLVKATTRVRERGETRSVRQSKNRKDAELYLRRDTARLVAQHLKARSPGERIWWVPDKPVVMMDVDREAAGLTRETLYGVLDFHALRHTFCTRVGSNPENSIKTCQELMRHSDVRLTARYMHTTVLNQVAAVESMPALGDRTRSQKARATGTDGTPAERPRRARRPDGFQREVQREAFPPGPGSSRPFRGGAVEKPPKTPGNDGEPAVILRLPLPGQLRSTEPKVAGSSPARCVSPSHSECSTSGGDAAASPCAAPDVSAPGAAHSGSAPAAPADPPAPSLEQLEQLYLWLGHQLNKQPPKGGSK